jgi:hypothetical protein
MSIKLVPQICFYAVASVFISGDTVAQTSTTKTPKVQGLPATAKNIVAPAALEPAKVISKLGLWQTTTIGVLDTGARSESIATRCITAQDVRSPAVLLPLHAVVGLTCTNRDVKFNGNKATWKVSCIGNGQAIEGDGSFTFAAQSHTGSSKLAHGVGGKTVKTDKTFTAKFMGPCDAPNVN